MCACVCEPSGGCIKSISFGLVPHVDEVASVAGWFMYVRRLPATAATQTTVRVALWGLLPLGEVGGVGAAQLAPSGASSCIFKLPARVAAAVACSSFLRCHLPLATSGFRLVVFRACYLCTFISLDFRSAS